MERLLAAGEVALRPVDPEHPDARRCVAAYFAELDARSGGGFDPATSRTPRPDLFLVAYRGEEAVGCGGVTHHDGWSEIKRVWVADDARGLGLARRLMAALEADAVRHGAAVAAARHEPPPHRGAGALPLDRLRRDPRRSTTRSSPTTGSRSSSASDRPRQLWLKKPFSISRARSSEESSTLRGVSRKTLSAMRCMPPSRA